MRALSALAALLAIGASAHEPDSHLPNPGRNTSSNGIDVSPPGNGGASPDSEADGETGPLARATRE